MHSLELQHHIESPYPSIRYLKAKKNTQQSYPSKITPLLYNLEKRLCVLNKLIQTSGFDRKNDINTCLLDLQEMVHDAYVFKITSYDADGKVEFIPIMTPSISETNNISHMAGLLICKKNMWYDNLKMTTATCQSKWSDNICDLYNNFFQSSNRTIKRLFDDILSHDQNVQESSNEKQITLHGNQISLDNSSVDIYLQKVQKYLNYVQCQLNNNNAQKPRSSRKIAYIGIITSTIVSSILFYKYMQIKLYKR